MIQKILLAEDDNDMRRFLVKALEKAGYQLSSFDNGASAYDRLREEPFSLLLTDIVMPEMDGIELARRATELDPDLKVMFITGFAAVALNADSKAPKDAKVLSKGVDMVVANDVSATDSGFGTDTNAVTFVYPERDPEPMPLMDKVDVGNALLDRALPLLK